ncbi:MAG: ABC-2 transporter permease [Oscillospiraceae bacterium]|nr:ABC-2 transporter permease [Oscillospiraceae bacterium]
MGEMRKTLDLIKVDLITMNGGKNNMRMIFAGSFIFCAVMGFLFSSMFGILFPLLMGAFFVPMLFQNELKYHSEKMYSVIPIKRRDLVNARFLLAVGLFTALFLVFYLLMLLGMNLRLSYAIFGEEAALVFDRIAYLALISNGMFTKLGVFNLMYSSGYAFGMIATVGQLRKYFRSSEGFSGTLTFGTSKEARRQEFTAGMIVLGVLIVSVLAIADILPIIPILLPILATLLQLAQVANGFMLSAVMIVIAVLTTVYRYVCTVVEYDEKEL